MELLMLTGLPRLAILNPTAFPEHESEWRAKLGQRFGVVAAFNAHQASAHDRIALVRTLATVVDKWRDALSRIADEIENDWDGKGKLHLRMTCHVNGKLISDGNTNDLYHSFGDMIERASMNTKLVPGEYIGSGTVGTGCILELRPENTGGWIKKGDIVTMGIEKLGILENKII
jgi:2-keto-4-pentenoate hydratase/2-oxohepta-3-ene-1,7-dioic acid hydratase in catechol pathway